MLKFTTLASSSLGNAALVSCGNTHILLDAGISAKRIVAGLAQLGVKPFQLSAILLTHEHSDHVSGLQVLTKKCRVPILATGPTCRRARRVISGVQWSRSGKPISRPAWVRTASPSSPQRSRMRR